MDMRLIWPILEPPRGFHYLIDLAVDDVDELVHEQGFTTAGTPREWEVKLGPEVGWDCRLVLTCVIKVEEAA